MNGHAYPDRPIPRAQAGYVAACLVLAAVAVVAVLAVIAPTANAGPDRTITGSIHFDELGLSDAWLSEACGFEVVAVFAGDIERKLVVGNGRKVAARETQTVDGTITWIARESGRSISDKIENRSRVEYPEGVDSFPLPAHVTVTGSHGGTFPFGGGPPGNGKFEYDAQVYSGAPGELPYYFAVSEPTWDGKSFERATAKVCASLT